MTDKYEPPKAVIGDHAHSIARAGLGSIPYFGGAAVELFQMVVVPSLERRRVEWMHEIAEALRVLEEKDRTCVERLASNDAFIDVLLQASSAALRTSNREKLVALRNAVVNSALPSPPEESRQHMFVQWVDTLTVWHLRILRLLANPTRWFKENGQQPPQYAMTSSLSQLLVDAYEELKDHRELYDLIGKDLFNRGLIGTDGFHTMITANGALTNRATGLGEQFIAFITVPPE